MRVQGAIEIVAPPEKIWPFLVEPEKILQWCVTLEKFEYTGEQRGGVGTTFYFEERAAERLLKLNFVVMEWEENERLTFSKTSGDFLKIYEQRWALMATPYGSRFIFMEQVELPYGIIGKIIGLFARRRSEATVEEMLVKLKSLSEA
ncbi:SRPBCC family protein [Chloroflexota bacterium]